MSSASTFANNVVAVLQEREQEKKFCFELFFTDHSLGGCWRRSLPLRLSTLKIKKVHFLRNGNENKTNHLHAGQCKTLMMSDTFIIRTQ